MAMTMRSDIARAMYVGTKEVFMDNLKKQPQEEWKAYATVKKSDKMEETYDSVGNLKPAHIKAEGDSVVYGKITEAYKTTVKNDTIANGFQVSMEAKEDETWNLVDKTKVSELIRTMIAEKEEAVAKVWDDVQTAVGADGVAYASHQHPLLHVAGEYNDNLLEGEFNFDNYDALVKMFNHWKNHYNQKFFTRPSALLLHRDRQTEALALLNSNLKPFEQSNTKNTIPQLKLIFSSYIASLPVHAIDETIDSAIMQKRKGLVTQYDYDKRDTFNFYFNVHERYKAAMINPGFGFATLTGTAV